MPYRKHWCSLLAIFILLAAPGLSGCFARGPGSELAVYYFDVGQGDAILIDRGETEVLIDGGAAGAGLAEAIEPYVQGNLEAVVATHPHADHIGGLPQVLAQYGVNAVWDNGESADTAAYRHYVQAVQAEGLTPQVGRSGGKINIGELTFAILNPEKLVPLTNVNSLVLNLKYGETAFLFEGDAEGSAEMVMLEGELPHVTVLKVGHHGSRTASTKYFLAVTHPEVAIYTAGRGNEYGHPHQETLTALFRIGARIYGTDVNGTVRVTSDGKGYEVKTAREGAPQAGGTS